MATTTPRLGLTKPAGTDLVDIAVINANYDILDNQLVTTPSTNYVINGGFDVWQRGTSITNGYPIYGADRWMAYGSGSGVNSRQVTGDTTNLPNIQYCQRIQRTAGNSTTNALYTSQSFETSMSRQFSGQTVTLSWYARAGANFSASASGMSYELVYGTGTDQNVIAGFTGQTNASVGTKTLTTTWQRFSVTATIPASATQVAINFYYIPSGTAGANDYFEITGVQLEIGSVATTFRRNAPSIAGELAACQRYYQQTYPFGYGAGTVTTAGALMQYVPATGNSIRLPIQLGTRMRTAPVVNTYGPNTGAATKWQYEGAGTTNQFEAGVTFGSESGFLLYATGATVAGGHVYIHYTASAEL